MVKGNVADELAVPKATIIASAIAENSIAAETFEKNFKNSGYTINICIAKPINNTPKYFEILINISIPKLETADAVKANTPGAAKNIIQSVIFMVAAKTDSKNETIGLFTSPTRASAIAKITTKTIIGTISPAANDWSGLLGIKPRKRFKILPCC